MWPVRRQRSVRAPARRWHQVTRTRRAARRSVMDEAVGHWSDAASLAVPPWIQPHSSTVPATGAWRPSDPLGQRQFMRMAVDRAFVLEGGGQLHDLTICFETWGTLNADASNAVLVCHALTGDAH